MRGTRMAALASQARSNPDADTYIKHPSSACSSSAVQRGQQLHLSWPVLLYQALTPMMSTAAPCQNVCV